MHTMPRDPAGGGRHAYVGPLTVAVGAVAALVPVALFDPSSSGSFLRCPLNALTGHWCPGCGMTRATHSLLRGDPIAALGSNLMLPVFAALMIGGWLAWFRAARHQAVPLWPGRAPKWSWALLGATMAGFTIARNLPFAPFDALAP